MTHKLESPENFDFQKYTYQVLFESQKTNFLRQFFTGKDTKQVYYIRRIENSKYIECGPEILSKDGDLGYYFKCLRYRANYWKTVYWNNPSDPQELITRMMSKFICSSGTGNDSDYVIFSSSDLTT